MLVAIVWWPVRGSILSVATHLVGVSPVRHAHDCCAAAPISKAVTKVLEKIGGFARIQGAVGAIARFLRRSFGELQ